MTDRTKMIVAACMGLSLTTFASAQPAQNGTGQASGASTPVTGVAPTATADPVEGSIASDLTRNLQGGADADAKMKAELDKIATLGDRIPDALFVGEVAGGNLWEVEFAKLAQQKSQDSQIKELAAMIQKDHSEANEKLRPIAQKFGLDIPSVLPSAKQQKLAIFGSLPAEKFDTVYLLMNKADHAKDITSFADHQKAVQDADLKEFIGMVLPKLKEHGAHVNELAAAKGFPATSAGDHAGMDHGQSGAATGGMNGATGNGAGSGMGGTGGGSTATGTGAAGTNNR